MYDSLLLHKLPTQEVVAKSLVIGIIPSGHRGTWVLVSILTLTYGVTSGKSTSFPGSSPIKWETRWFSWSIGSIVLEFSSALTAPLPAVQCDPALLCVWGGEFTYGLCATD